MKNIINILIATLLVTMFALANWANWTTVSTSFSEKLWGSTFICGFNILGLGLAVVYFEDHL